VGRPREAKRICGWLRRQKEEEEEEGGQGWRLLEERSWSWRIERDREGAGGG